ncbi:MAG: hypothetical protein JW809_06835 [Pirellulales bacterium]|nr:hypothetical protein [Pirellulales bacterium]
MPQDGQTDEGKRAVKLLPIKWPEGVHAVYANNLLVQHDAGVLIFSFFQVNPPYLLGPSAKDQLEGLTEVGALPVAKIVIPLSGIPPAIKAIQEQFDEANKKKGEPADATNDD